MNAGCILLSGGKSSRMGTNKALLKIDGKPNIERIRDELVKLTEEIILVTNEPETYQFLGLTTIMDEYPGQGPLAGIHVGLKHSTKKHNLVVACDMPFVSQELGSYLLNIAIANDYDAVIPIINGKRQPLFAVYQKEIYRKIEKCIHDQQLKIMDVLTDLNVLFLTEAELQQNVPNHLERIFFNMNHVEEYEMAKKWAEAGE